MPRVSAPKLALLERLARDAAAHAYAPYSRFSVGAAVLTDGGEIFAGANVENASYGLSMCAERNAVHQAVSHGARAIAAIVIYTPTAEPTPPCGACRQVIAEFGRDTLIVCCGAGGKVRRHRLTDLLPDAFGSGSLVAMSASHTTARKGASQPRQLRRRRP
ncbi:MAG TPA: cytidine deaminase [Casimicrobiaceae bacterium]|nr:cytidine deaminase [Casimicrobiaceae bacterium]